MTEIDPKVINDLFGPITQTVSVELFGKTYEVPAEIPVLRALQYIEMVHQGVKIDYSKLCWNNRCHNCLVEYETRSGKKKLFEACQLTVCKGLKITDIPIALDL